MKKHTRTVYTCIYAIMVCVSATACTVHTTHSVNDASYVQMLRAIQHEDIHVHVGRRSYYEALCSKCMGIHVLNLQYIVYGHNSIRVHYIVVCEQVPIVSHIYVTS